MGAGGVSRLLHLALLRSSQEMWARRKRRVASCVCVLGAHVRFRGGAPLHKSSLTLTTLTARRFTPRFADEKLSRGLDEWPVSGRPGSQAAAPAPRGAAHS